MYIASGFYPQRLNRIAAMLLEYTEQNTTQI